MTEVDNDFVKVPRVQDRSRSPFQDSRAPAQDSSGLSTGVTSADQTAAVLPEQHQSKFASLDPGDLHGDSDECGNALRRFSASLADHSSTVAAFCLPESIHRGEDSHAQASDVSQPSQAMELTDKSALEQQKNEKPVDRKKVKQQIMQDKCAFFLGVVNLVLSAFWLGKSPETWHRWFTLKALILFSVRYKVYRAKHWHYYMLEFCYFANFVLLIQLWLLPHWAWLYKATFALIAGPMTGAIAALGNSLVLHSLDKTTSLFMHVSPAIMAWCLRWYPAEQAATRRAKDPRKWEEASLVDLIVLPILLYCMWAAFYYVKIFVWSSEKVTKQNYSTLYSLMVGKKGSLPARIVLQAPVKLQPATYMTMHLLMVTVATFTSVIWWRSYWAHTFWVVVCASSSAWLGATYQFDIFAYRYLPNLGLQPSIKKKQ